MTGAQPDTVLTLKRSFAAPPEAVFDAWTSPEVLRRWWAAGPSWKTPLAEVDLRPGGRYRLSMRDAESGHTHTVAGEYLEVRRPHRLVYTWRWEPEPDMPVGAGTSFVAIDFIDDAEGTTVLLTHSDLGSAVDRDQHMAGWTGCLDNLDQRVIAETGANRR